MNLSMPEIETERLYLRGLEEEDLCDLFEYCTMEETMQYLSGPRIDDIDEMFDLLKTFYLSYQDRMEPQVWCLEEKHTGAVIGHMYFHEMNIDQAEIAYLLHPSYWKQGYMMEALPSLLSIGFLQFGLQRIVACIAVENSKSRNLVKRLGFTQKTIIKQAEQLADQQYHDMVLYEILEKDWRMLYEKDIRSKI